MFLLHWSFISNMLTDQKKFAGSAKQVGWGHRKNVHNGINFLHETPWLTNFHSSLIHTLLREGTCNDAVSKAANLRGVLFFVLPSLEGFNHFWYSHFQFSILLFVLFCFFPESWLSMYPLIQAQDFVITHWYTINSTQTSYQFLHKMGMTFCHIWVAASKSLAWQRSAFFSPGWLHCTFLQGHAW